MWSLLFQQSLWSKIFTKVKEPSQSVGQPHSYKVSDASIITSIGHSCSYKVSDTLTESDAPTVTKCQMHPQLQSVRHPHKVSDAPTVTKCQMHPQLQSVRCIHSYKVSHSPTGGALYLTWSLSRGLISSSSDELPVYDAVMMEKSTLFVYIFRFAFFGAHEEHGSVTDTIMQCVQDWRKRCDQDRKQWSCPYWVHSWTSFDKRGFAKIGLCQSHLCVHTRSHKVYSKIEPKTGASTPEPNQNWTCYWYACHDPNVITAWFCRTSAPAACWSLCTCAGQAKSLPCPHSITTLIHFCKIEAAKTTFRTGLGKAQFDHSVDREFDLILKSQCEESQWQWYCLQEMVSYTATHSEQHSLMIPVWLSGKVATEWTCEPNLTAACSTEWLLIIAACSTKIMI